MTLTVRCPAKLNLFLSVGPPDRRGYHPIRSVFQAIDLYDVLRIEPADEDAVVCDDPDVPAENTVTKALRLLREVAPLPPLKVHLSKEIPAESGLGGGSSDAAGLLRAAKRLAPGLPEAELAGIALAVGADVPFFLVGGRARAEGYGERLTPLPDGPDEWYVVLRPPVGCPTGEMYRKLDEKPRDWADYGEGLYNDFERVAPCECLDWIERLLTLGARDAGLSGSGSAVFGRFESPEQTRAVAAEVRTHGVRAYACRSLGRVESLALRAD